MTPAGRSPTRSPRSSPHAWDRLNIANDDFIRTTEPRHKAAVAELLQRCYDAGDIELDTFSGKYCVGCEEYYTDDELVDDRRRRPTAARSTSARSSTSRRRTTSSASAASQDRLLDWYAAHPTRSSPSTAANEAIGLIKSGLRDFSISRTIARVGHPAPVGPRSTSPTCGSTRSPTTSSAVGFGDGTDQDYTDWWPVDYHLIGKDIVRQHCVYWPAMLMSAGVEPPKG